MIQILVIDDEDLIRNLLARMIELEGYKVWKASDWRNAQFKQKQRKVNMRGMNCKWLRMSNIS